MSDALIDHVWQSTLFALLAALTTLALKQDQAKVRFNIWLAASVKFLIPFELIVWIGKHLHFGGNAAFLGGTLTNALEQMARPAAVLKESLPAMPLLGSTVEPGWNAWNVALAVWLAGALLLFVRRVYQWLYLRVVADLSLPLSIDAPIPVREAATTLEPGLFGILSPTLLLPRGIAQQLTPTQLAAVLEHEMCHWRRRDNLTAAIHMLVEVLFWFHPLVWWVGGQLVAERERACDEAVIRSGSDPHAYAEGILEICRRYVKGSLCSAGISGGNLKKRLEEIMTTTIIDRLSLAKKCALTFTGCATLAVPLAIGFSSGSQVALAQPTDMVMRHYKSAEWQFELDVPERWVKMPPVSSNSPLEVMRFSSQENGTQALIVFRGPIDPRQSVDDLIAGAQGVLAKNGFSNFVRGETSLGPNRRVATLDFSRVGPNGQPWHCHYYYFLSGTLRYVLAFGTSSDPGEMLGLYDRMATTFEFQPS